MKITSLLSSLIALLLIACQDTPKQTEPIATPTVEQDHTQTHEHGHKEKPIQVLLNNGEKWPANAETTEGIHTMSALLNALPAEPKAEDYRTLQTELDKAFGTIIQKCTMTGEAHNQLHNFILPIKDMIQELDSEDINECKSVSDKLKQHLKEYENYFQ